ncbi:MAG: hypothetical protein LBS56_01610, partial [Propionibacteriaceae bacterium]|nr:hypothetical protein [Propionibacteriaceae bacterium]
AALNTLIATFLKSWGAFGGFSIVMGVSIGFLGFCYTPPSVLTSAVNTVLGVLPFAQGASLIRAAVMRPSLDRLLTSVSDPAQVGPVDQGIQNALAMTLEVGGWTLPTLFLIGVLAVLAAVLTGLASWRMSHVIK